MIFVSRLLAIYRQVEFCTGISNLTVFLKFPWTRWKYLWAWSGLLRGLKWSFVIGELRNRFINIIWIKQELQLIFLYELLRGKLPVRPISPLILPRWVWLKLPCIIFIYYLRHFCNFIGSEQRYFSLIWHTYMWKLKTLCGL